MNKIIRKRKLKALMKIALDPSSALPPFKEHQGVKNKEVETKTYDYGTSSVSEGISGFVDKYMPVTPFGIAMTAALGFMPKGHTSDKDKAIHGDYIMPNLGIFESFEKFSEASLKVSNITSKMLIESIPGIGESIEVEQLAKDILSMTNNFLWGNQGKAKEDAKNVVIGAGLLFIPEVLEWIGKGIRAVYRKLIKKEYPDLSRSQIEDAVKEIPVDEIQREIDRHYNSQKMKNPESFVDNAFNHSLQINIPYHPIKHKRYFETFEDQIIDTITIVDDGIGRNIYIIKNPEPPGGRSLYYISSGTGDATVSGQVSRIEGVEPYFTDTREGGWYAKSYTAKFPQSGTVDEQIVKRLQEMDPKVIGQKKYHVKTKALEDDQIDYIKYQRKHLEEIEKIQKKLESPDIDDNFKEALEDIKQWHIEKLQKKDLDIEEKARVGDSYSKQQLEQMRYEIEDNVEPKYFDDNPNIIGDLLKEHGYDQSTSPVFDNRFRGSVHKKAPIQQALTYARFGSIRLPPNSIIAVKNLKKNPQDLRIEFNKLLKHIDPRQRELLNRYFRILDKVDYKNPAISGDQYIDLLQIRSFEDELFPFSLGKKRKQHIEIIDSLIRGAYMTGRELREFCKRWKLSNPGERCPYDYILSKIFR